MDRTILARVLGIIAAAGLAASAFAPMITAVLSAGSHSAQISGGPRYFLLGASGIAAVACARRAFDLAAAAGMLAFLLTAVLLFQTWRALVDGGLASFARPGWAFAVALPAAATLSSLAFWAAPRRAVRLGSRPSA